MLPSHLSTSSEPVNDYPPKRRHSQANLFLRRVAQDPSILRQHKPQIAGGALALLIVFLLLRPSSDSIHSSVIRWHGKEAQNWGDYVGLGLARAKVLEATPLGYVDIGDKWVGGGGPLYASRPRLGAVVEEAVGNERTLQRERDESFDRDRHGVLGGGSTEWSSGVVGMGTWLGERVDMRKNSARELLGEEDPLARLPAREALTAHIMKRGWEYLDEEDETNTKKMLAEAQADGTMEKLPLRDRVRGDPILSQEAAVGWSKIYGAMEAEGLKSALEVAVEKLVRRSPIVIFSKTTCPHSTRAKELLRKYHLSPEPHIIEVDLRPDGTNLKGLLARKTAHSTFPNIILAGRSIGGADDLEALERDHDSFIGLLKDAGITMIERLMVITGRWSFAKKSIRTRWKSDLGSESEDVAGKVCGTYFLIERVHVVHEAETKRKRRASKLYIFNVLVAALTWGASFVGFLVWGSSSLRPDGACVTHEKHAMALIVLGVEIGLNIYLGALFVVPLYRGAFSNVRIRWVAYKSLMAMFVVLASSSINIAVFSYFHTSELSWVCLGNCTLDTTVTSLTSGETSRSQSPTNTVTTMPSTKGSRKPKYSRSPSTYIFTQETATSHSTENNHNNNANSPFGNSPSIAREEKFFTIDLKNSKGSIQPIELIENVASPEDTKNGRNVTGFRKEDVATTGKEDRWTNLGLEPPGEDDPASWRGDSGRFEENLDGGAVPTATQESWEREDRAWQAL
ncbi:hypothetical protein P7C70_g5177, partial [Phenoliferia sp. Uapishka_3]